MIKNYFIITVRNLGKNAFFVIANIIGLAISISLCITAYYNSKFDADWDKYHENYNKIYKISLTKEIQDRQQDYGITPLSLAPLLQSKIAGINEICRYTRVYSALKKDKKVFNKRIGFADESFINIFTMEMLYGTKQSLKEKGKILISDKVAGIYFGKENPVGKIISLINNKEKEVSYIVGGVFKKYPSNSSMQFEALLHIDNYIKHWELDENNWKHWVAATFLLTDDEKAISKVNELLKSFIPVQNKAREDWKISGFFIEPLSVISDTGLNRWANWLYESMHPAAVISPPVMAILILILACFNFTNTSIAFAGKRLKEIGVRKVCGGHRKNIIIQFLSESAIITVFAGLLSLFFAKLLIPYYSRMWEGLEISLDLGETTFWVFFILLLLITIFMAGGYSAFYISRFNPINIFREKLKLGGRNILSKTLLTFQFIISFVALVAGMLFTQNAFFQEKMDHGYDKDNIIALPLTNNKQFRPLMSAIQQNPDIKSFAGTEEHIGWGQYNRNFEYKGQKAEVGMLDVGADYLQTMGLKIKEGRLFEDKFHQADIQNYSIVVNKKFVKDFKWEKATGKQVMMNDTIKMTIVGVVDNFYLYGVWSPVEPIAFRLKSDSTLRVIAVKAEQGKLSAVNEYLKKEWEAIVPNSPYEGEFQVELMKEAKQVNKNIRIIFVFLSVIAILLSVLGLFTLVSLNILRKIKEIGVRKVLGSTIGNIMFVTNKSFISIILIATILGCFAGHYITMMLMESIYKVHVDADMISFFIPVAIIFSMSIAVVVGKIYRAALRNPSQSLRYE